MATPRWVITKGSVVSRYMIASNIYIKVVIFQQRILKKVGIEVLCCHRGDKVFESGSISWVIAKVVAITISGMLP